MPAPADPGAWVCPLPLRDQRTIVLGHGGGGQLSAELIENLFVPAFGDATLSQLGDSAIIEPGAGRLAFSTDSFVVRPLFFPGGSIGELAVHGTVNDLAMSGAKPLYLSCGFILEEGLELATLGAIVERMAQAARDAGLRLVTGDTKVVERGHGDGVYVNTSGIGRIADGVEVRPQRARPGDAVLVSGTIGDHGMAIMSVREGLEFDTVIESDSAALHGLVAAMLEVSPDIRALRDPTRGGLAASLNEIASAAGVGIEIDERRLPVRPEVAAACEILGMDPLYVANEGKLAAIVPAADADALLECMRDHPLGAGSALIGRVREEHPGVVVARTGIGGTRVVDMQVGEQLPRIC